MPWLTAKPGGSLMSPAFPCPPLAWLPVSVELVRVMVALEPSLSMAPPLALPSVPAVARLPVKVELLIVAVEPCA